MSELRAAHREMARLYRQAGLRTAAARLAFASTVVGRALRWPGDIRAAEVPVVVDALHAAVKGRPS